MYLTTKYFSSFLSPIAVRKKSGTPQFHIDISPGVNHSSSPNPLHHHDYIQLWYLRSGCHSHFISGTNHTLFQGSMAVIPPRTEHYLGHNLTDCVELFRIEFSNSFIHPALSEQYRDTLFCMLYISTIIPDNKERNSLILYINEQRAGVERLLDEMLTEYKKGEGVFDPETVRQKLAELLVILMDGFNSETDKEELAVFTHRCNNIRKTIEYIHSNYAKPLSLTEVSRRAFLSPSRFSLVIKHITGFSLIDYINYLRVQKARELLLNTDKILYSICRECGFRNDNYFRRVFKEYSGCLPSEFREYYLTEKSLNWIEKK